MRAATLTGSEVNIPWLTDSTWAMVAHEQLSNHDPALGLLHPTNPLAHLPLAERVERYGPAGRDLVEGRSAESVVQGLRLGGSHE